MTEQRLVPCPGCQRHVFASERACPFCERELKLAATPLRPELLGRMSRAALFVLGTTLAGTACGGEAETKGTNSGSGNASPSTNSGGTSAGSGGPTSASGSANSGGGQSSTTGNADSPQVPIYGVPVYGAPATDGIIPGSGGMNTTGGIGAAGESFGDDGVGGEASGSNGVPVYGAPPAPRE